MLMKLKAVLLPKFEVGTLTGDDFGEAQCFYDAFLRGGETVAVRVGTEEEPLYVKDGIGMFLLGMGKVNATMRLQALLCDYRFDWSGTLFLGVGCAGSNYETTVPGDVAILSATVDGDLGHRADSREFEESPHITWFYDADYDSSAFCIMDQNLVQRAWNRTKDLSLDTTEETVRYIHDLYGIPEPRAPRVLIGTTVTTDCFWKGDTDRNNAIAAVRSHKCPDPYVMTEMEDNAMAIVLRQYGYLPHTLLLRVSVNYDIFGAGENPDVIWGHESTVSGLDSSSLDIFPTAMNNLLRVVEAILKNQEKNE